VAKITLQSITAAFSSISKLNANFSAIATAFENTLSRDGTSPNAMSADLDMNSNRILNLPTALNAAEPPRFDQLQTLIANAGFDWKGAWVTSTAYVANELVENNGTAYICILAHTSGSDMDEPGVGANTATYWDVIAEKGDTGATGAQGPAGVGFDSLNAQTGTTYTPVLSDANDTYITLSNASPITFTVPPNSSVAYPVGTVLTIEQIGAGQVTVAQGSGVTVNVYSADTLNLAGQYAVATLVKRATDTWTLTGRLELA
jgi:hypothetical protein